MAISQKKYVDITSIQKQKDQARSMDGRIYTSSAILPSGRILDFSDLNAVGEIFPTSSDEYKFAKKYFSFLSVNTQRPRSLSVANFNPVARKAILKATAQPVALATLKAVTTGSIKITLGGIASEITGLDFTESADYSSVATALQTAIRAVNANGEAWTAATVTYDATIGFILEGGTAGDCVIGYASAASTGTDISGMLKWTADDLPFISNGADAETPVQCLTRTLDNNPTCGSFMFMDALTSAQITAVAEWNHNQNIRYMYSVSVDSTNYATIQPLVKDYDGIGLTYGDDKYVCYMPMAIMSATDYTATDGTVNYMFTQFTGETPSVTSTTLSDRLDGLRVNYYGQTQRAGQPLSFYQRGYLQGSVYDMGVYANEMWLKSAIESRALLLLTSKGKIPANSTGVGLFRANIQPILDQAVNNGTIQLNRTLTVDERVSVVDLTGDTDAVGTLNSIGYWIRVEIKEVPANGVTEYYLTYLLLYAKGDSVRKIEGSNILI